MDFNLMHRLRPIGFTPAMAQGFTALGDAPGQPMRVLEVHRETVRVTDGLDEHSARPSPGLLRTLTEAGEALAVGDWVLVVGDETHAQWVAFRVAPMTQIVRRNSSGARQPLVTNVDTALLVMGLDGDFNLRRLERYLAMVKPAGIWPVVVLTKRDLCDDINQRLDALRDRLPHDIAVHAVDARALATALELAAYFGADQTVVVLGSSGAGKSTLTNTLLGLDVQSTGGVREDDSRGRHTTTSRSLHRLPSGGCVIDTPGLRGLRPDIDETDLARSFGDIDGLAEHCRFRDCQHGDEPGCAVRDGVARDRLVNYQKMLREIRRDTLTPLQRREQLSVWKSRHRGALERMKLKRGKTD
ncbi:MAG: ribosome small subunit-dependent GTPase A [Burkholderiaceae bacterium]|nr:ribosome small subunit-dependent GTPase A [Burkholderiaceae bacterium]